MAELICRPLDGDKWSRPQADEPSAKGLYCFRPFLKDLVPIIRRPGQPTALVRSSIGLVTFTQSTICRNFGPYCYTFFRDGGVDISLHDFERQMHDLEWRIP